MPSKKTTDPAKQKLQARADEILALTAEFCRLHLDNEYAALCQKLIGKMSRKRDVPFVAGRTDIWAGSVIYALGQINFLFDSSRRPHVKEADIARYFHSTTTTLGMKAKAIRDMFKLRRWDPEFSTKRTVASNPFAGMVSINGLIVPVSMLGQLTILRPDKE